MNRHRTRLLTVTAALATVSARSQPRSLRMAGGEVEMRIYKSLVLAIAGLLTLTLATVGNASPGPDLLVGRNIDGSVRLRGPASGTGGAKRN